MFVSKHICKSTLSVALQQAKALRQKAEREEKLAAAVLQNTPVGIEVSLSTGSMEMKLSKNSPLDMKNKNVTTDDGPIQIKGNVGGCAGNVGLQVSSTSVRLI